MKYKKAHAVQTKITYLLNDLDKGKIVKRGTVVIPTQKDSDLIRCTKAIIEAIGMLDENNSGIHYRRFKQEDFNGLMKKYKL